MGVWNRCLHDNASSCIISLVIMSIQLQILPEHDLSAFKRDMQEAFQKGAEAEYGSISEVILPESHINASLS